MARLTDRRAAWTLCAVLFVSYAYFYQAGGWNQNSRFALDRAIIERHTLEIDAYQLHTGDRAIWNGHYYSDKAPGASLLALAPTALARVVSRAAGVDPESFPGIAWTSYAATVATSGIFTVIAALVIFTLTRRWGASRPAALFAASAYGLAGPAWAYATLFMGHGVSAGALMLAFAASVAMDDDTVSSTRRRVLAWAVGLCAGWAVVTEFPAAVPAALIALLALVAIWQHARSDAPALVARVAAGAALMAAVIAAYNAAAFGSPFHLGYSSEDPRFGQMQQGLFGITRPAWWRVRELLVGSYRGLLPISPLLAVAPIGWMLLARADERRRAVLVAAAITLFYLLLNASYYYWEGGWAYGPRQLTPALPFLALGLAPVWDRLRGAARGVIIAGWIWGAAITLIAVSTTPQPPSNVKSPVIELLWPAFRDGDLSLNHQTFEHYAAVPDLLRGNQVPHASWNLGEIAGLHGRRSLVPLLLVWAGAGLILVL
jgi:hypothetical protein